MTKCYHFMTLISGYINVHFFIPSHLKLKFFTIKSWKASRVWDGGEVVCMKSKRVLKMSSWSRSLAGWTWFQFVSLSFVWAILLQGSGPECLFLTFYLLHIFSVNKEPSVHLEKEINNHTLLDFVDTWRKHL
jgi:hypothetical protein